MISRFGPSSQKVVSEDLIRGAITKDLQSNVRNQQNWNVNRFHRKDVEDLAQVAGGAQDKVRNAGKFHGHFAAKFPGKQIVDSLTKLFRDKWRENLVSESVICNFQ